MLGIWTHLQMQINATPAVPWKYEVDRSRDVKEQWEKLEWRNLAQL